MLSVVRSDRLVTCRLPFVVSVRLVALSASGAATAPRLPDVALSVTVPASTRVFVVPSSRMLPAVEVTFRVASAPVVIMSPRRIVASLVKSRVFSFGLPSASRMVVVPLSLTVKLK